MKQLILGSQSPRRKEILGYFSLPFKQVGSSFDENSIAFKGDPQQYVRALSSAKAEALLPKFSDEIILTADTVVFQQGKIYNKPLDEEEAFGMLSELVGQWHSVYTGVTVRHGKKEFQQVEETRVLFNPLSPDQISHYLKHMNWQDKAGGYAIQMVGGLIVKRIEGCYYNVMGLPVNTVHDLLKKVGIDLWNYL